MLRHGSREWLLAGFGIATILAGLWLWHGLGSHFGLRDSHRRVSRRAAMRPRPASCYCLVWRCSGVGSKLERWNPWPEGPKQFSPGQRPGETGQDSDAFALKGRNRLNPTHTVHRIRRRAFAGNCGIPLRTKVAGGAVPVARCIGARGRAEGRGPCVPVPGRCRYLWASSGCL